MEGSSNAEKTSARTGSMNILSKAVKYLRVCRKTKRMQNV